MLNAAAGQTPASNNCLQDSYLTAAMPTGTLFHGSKQCMLPVLVHESLLLNLLAGCSGADSRRLGAVARLLW
jgi:hypothetical protein